MDFCRGAPLSRGGRRPLPTPSSGRVSGGAVLSRRRRTSGPHHLRAWGQPGIGGRLQQPARVFSRGRPARRRGASGRLAGKSAFLPGRIGRGVVVHYRGIEKRAGIIDKEKKMKKIAAVMGMAAFLALPASAARAQEEPAGSGHALRTQDNLITFKLLRMTQFLELTEEQTTKIYPALTRLEREKFEISNRLNDRLRSLRGLLSAGKPGES